MVSKLIPPSQKRINWGEVAFASTAAGVAGAWGSAELYWYFSPLPDPAYKHLLYWTLGGLHFAGFETAAWQKYVAFMLRFELAGYDWQIPLRMIVSGTAAITAGFFAGKYAARPQDRNIHRRGRQLKEGNEALNSARREAPTSKTGIYLHPRLRISEDMETKHILIYGGTGSGKSVICWQIMLEAERRNDRKIIFDYKGITQAWPKGSSFVICCPWDSRSGVWHIAADVQTKQQAKNIAARLIVESTDPLWSNAARQILVAVIVSLQQEKGIKWTWRDLAETVSLPQPKLAEIARKYHPEALRAVEEANKTTDSILINMSSFMSVIYDLADAWGNRQGTLSLTRWLKDPESAVRTIIFKLSDDFEQLTQAYLQSAIGIIGSVVDSLPECKPSQNPLWIFSDEHPRLGKVEGWSKFMEVGRSKSMRVVTITQTPNQIREIYGDKIFESWNDMVPTKIFCKSEGDAAKWIAEQAGEEEVERIVETISTGTGGTTVTKGYQRELIPVLLPSQISTELGPQKDGIRAILHGLKNTAILTWPYPSIDPATREATELAEWCKALEDWSDAKTERQMTIEDRRHREENRWKRRLETQLNADNQANAIATTSMHIDPSQRAETVENLITEELLVSAAEAVIGGNAEVLKIGLEILDAASSIDEQMNSGNSPAVASKRRRLVRKRITHEQEIH